MIHVMIVFQEKKVIPQIIYVPHALMDIFQKIPIIIKR